MAINKGKQIRKEEQIPKSRLSSDRGLQPAHVKSELLVIADQHAAVNTFPGLVHTLTDPERFGDMESPEEAARRLCEGLAYFYAARKRTCLEETTEDLLCGCCAVVFDGVAVTFETKQPQGRGVEKSELEKSVKGAKDSFTEVYRQNTALLRQRIRTPELKLEPVTLGRRSSSIRW